MIKAKLCIFVVVLATILMIFSPLSVQAFPMQSGYVQPQSVTQQVYSANVIIPKQQVIQSTSNQPAANTVKTQPKTSQKAASSGPSLSIPAINLQSNLDYATIQNLADLDNKILYNPAVESAISADVCTAGRNSYIAGHSEPAIASTKNYPAVYVFSRLTELKPGDKIFVTGRNGASCTYQVTHWETVVTNQNDQVPQSVFNNLYNPNTNGRSMLTIQTCQKGSATVRLILRAEMVL